MSVEDENVYRRNNDNNVDWVFLRGKKCKLLALLLLLVVMLMT
jgi:hypothetical protein